jgi:hypothetical protein
MSKSVWYSRSVVVHASVEAIKDFFNHHHHPQHYYHVQLRKWSEFACLLLTAAPYKSQTEWVQFCISSTRNLLHLLLLATFKGNFAKTYNQRPIVCSLCVLCSTLMNPSFHGESLKKSLKTDAAKVIHLFFS